MSVEVGACGISKSIPYTVVFYLFQLEPHCSQCSSFSTKKKTFNFHLEFVKSVFIHLGKVLRHEKMKDRFIFHICWAQQ